MIFNLTDNKSLWTLTGAPELIRCYSLGDNEVTVVFHGRYQHRTNGRFLALKLFPDSKSNCAYTESLETDAIIDRQHNHQLGRRVRFRSLQHSWQKLIIREYCLLWGTDMPIQISGLRAYPGYAIFVDEYYNARLGLFPKKSEAIAFCADLFNLNKGHQYRTIRLPI